LVSPSLADSPHGSTGYRVGMDRSAIGQRIRRASFIENQREIFTAQHNDLRTLLLDQSALRH
jgi:hypothetical protein